MRLPEWPQLFDERLPGFEHVLRQPEADLLGPEIDALQSAGELAGYTRDEFLTRKVAIVWRKP